MTISTTVYTFTGQTISSTEIDLTSNTSSIQSRTALGIYQLFIDLVNMTATETYRLKIYEKATTTSSQRIVQSVDFNGSQTEPVYVTPALLLGEGWTFSLQKIVGTDRTFSWSVRAVT